MRYPPSILEEIKAKLPASLVVGKRIPIKKAGKEWRGLSPFNAEKTPSFYVNDHKQAWFDFSSGRNGDIFTFLMEVEGISFVEAVEKLASEAGVTLPVQSQDNEFYEKKRLNLYEVMELARGYFSDLLQSPSGRNAREYLNNRGIHKDIIERFGLGFASIERFALREYLSDKKVPIELMIEAGLLISGEDIKIPYDRFRDRIIFPIADIRGRIIAFGGRALQKDAQAKYLNSPETPLFHKGANLYNLHVAKKIAHETGNVFIVEGYIDVIALSRINVDNVVAPLGTALTEEQLSILWRMVKEPVLCFDGDKAGLRAAYRAIDLALPLINSSQSLRFIFLPNGKDPDETLRDEGAEVLKKALLAQKPLVDVLFDREVESFPLETPEQKADCEKRIFAAINNIKDENLRRYYNQAMRKKISELFWAKKDQKTLSKTEYLAKKDKFSSNITISDKLKRTPLFMENNAISSREAALVLACLYNPEILEIEAETLAELQLKSQAAKKIRSSLLDCAAKFVNYKADTEDNIAKYLKIRGELLEKGLENEITQLEQSAKAENWINKDLLPEDRLRIWHEAAQLENRQSFLEEEIKAVSQDFSLHGGEERFEMLKALLQRRDAAYDD